MNESLIKDNKRVQQHGEVFTPDWIIEKMLAIPEITEKLKNIDATFLEIKTHYLIQRNAA